MRPALVRQTLVPALDSYQVDKLLLGSCHAGKEYRLFTCKYCHLT